MIREPLEPEPEERHFVGARWSSEAALRDHPNEGSVFGFAHVFPSEDDQMAPPGGVAGGWPGGVRGVSVGPIKGRTTGTIVDIYLSAGVTLDGNPSCDVKNQGNCGLYRVRWDLGLEKVVEVERIAEPTLDDGGLDIGHIEPAVADDGGLAWIERVFDRTASTTDGLGKETAAGLVYRAPGALTPDILRVGLDKADRPQWPWFFSRDTILFEQADGGTLGGKSDWRTMWSIRTDGTHRQTQAGPKAATATETSFGNPQSHDFRALTFGRDLDNSHAATENNPRVTTIVGGAEQPFNLGGDGFTSCQHPTWSPDGTRIACTRQDATETIDSREQRLLYVFDRLGGQWNKVSRLFKPRLLDELPAAYDGLDCELLTYKYAQWCGDENHVVVTVFCTTLAGTGSPEMSRVLLVEFSDPDNPHFHDITHEVGVAFPELGRVKTWRSVFSTCHTVE